MQVNYLNKEGLVAGQIELNDSIFAIQPHEHAIHLAVKAYLANQRQGTHKTKTRTEVSGGGKKPWKQKGRGTARSGSSRSPVWVGGGTVHGPKPHLYKISLPKKVRALARKSALSIRLQENNLVFIEDILYTKPKTKDIAIMLKKISVGNDKAVLVIQPNSSSGDLTNIDSQKKNSEQHKNVLLSARNIPTLSIKASESLSTYDIMSHKKIIICIGALNKIVENLS